MRELGPISQVLLPQDIPGTGRWRGPNTEAHCTFGASEPEDLSGALVSLSLFRVWGSGCPPAWNWQGSSFLFIVGTPALSREGLKKWWQLYCVT